jgi:hypothetical protein
MRSGTHRQTLLIESAHHPRAAAADGVRQVVELIHDGAGHVVIDLA